MRLAEYQEQTEKYAVYPDDKAFQYLVTGLVSEVGELAGHLAKRYRGDENYRDVKKTHDLLVKELGDILWFVARLSDGLGYRLDDVAILNLEKLKSRAARGVLKGSGDNR